MSWRFRHRERRLAQRDADALDTALSKEMGAAPEGAAPSTDAVRFAREIAAARMVASSIPPPVEPPDSSRIALRAGLAVRRSHAPRPARRAAFGLASMVAAAAAVLVLDVSSNGANPPAPMAAQAQRSLDVLASSVKRLEAAISTGNPVLINQSASAAQVAARDATDQVAALPQPSRGIAMKVTTQQVEVIQWLVTQSQASMAAQSTSTTAPKPTTTTTGTPTTTTPRRSTTTTTPDTTTSTSTSSTSSTTSVPSTTTTEAPTTTTEAPTTVPPPSPSTVPPSPTTTQTPSRW
jgi:hypothetical protein